MRRREPHDGVCVEGHRSRAAALLREKKKKSLTLVTAVTVAVHSDSLKPGVKLDCPADQGRNFSTLGHRAFVEARCQAGLSSRSRSKLFDLGSTLSRCHS